MNDPIVGIDLGTSNTVVAYADTMGNTTVLADDAGYKIHPSVVSFHPSGSVLAGYPARERRLVMIGLLAVAAPASILPLVFGGRRLALC